jgi:putative methionine-R-sulfoxide reductase with GAF domain
MFKLFRKYNQPVVAMEQNQATEPENINVAVSNNNIEPADSLKERIVDLGDTPLEFSTRLLSFLAKEKELSQGIFFSVIKKADKDMLKYLAGYAFDKEDTTDIEIEFGEGFTGQVAVDGKLMNISDVPDDYLSVVSGLGKAKPASVVIVPLIYNRNVVAVIELASFHRFTSDDEVYFKEVASYAAAHFKKIRTKK